MTANGTFIVNGTERVIVSQMHRSPGVFFDHDKGKSHSSGKLLFAARIIPYRGSWLDIEFDAKDIVHARIDRRRKIPVTSLLFALGLDGEDILSIFYKKAIYSRDKGAGWRVPLRSRPDEGHQGRQRTHRRRHRRSRGRGRPQADACARLKSAGREGAKGLCARPDADLNGQYLGEDLYSPETGEIFAEAGDEITEKTAGRRCSRRASTSCRSSRSITSTSAPTSATTLKVDKNTSREDALFDIYRVMRPGEPPTIESAEAMFQSLFFDSASATTSRRSAA